MTTVLDDASLIRRLSALRPTPPRQTNVFEALELGRSESPHSLWLAWLLSPQGPLTDGWLLKSLLARVAADVAWPGEPTSVLPEVEEGSDRPDIVAEWPAFRLVIEFKLGSPEGKRQAARYLETFEISGPGEGRLIFLTPTGRWPSSVEDGDPRVFAMSFEQLIQCIDAGIADETSDRGRVMAAEYRACLYRALYRSVTVSKPNISEATKMLAVHSERLESLEAGATREATDVINYLVDQARPGLKKILGPEMAEEVRDDWGIFSFRKPSWTNGKFRFGVAYGCDGKLGAKRMQAYGHYLGSV